VNIFDKNPRANRRVTTRVLSVARSTVSTDSWSGAPLQWQEASADKLPFPGGSFDIVYCQLGRQFFADRAAALRAAPLEE
jgi:ubiquinone/menaquinone biosynthesis C-methylase UbiE